MKQNQLNFCFGLFGLGILSFLVSPVFAQYELQEHSGGVRVLHDGELVADYLTKSMSKPILWPLIGPGGARMTRDYPMIADSENEKHDHPHHRSLWFTHGDVNGTDFWLEGGQSKKGGITQHLEFTKLSGGQSATIATRNLWTTAEGTPVLSDRRRFTFHTDGNAQILDCEFLLTASEGDVNFGDTKEGTFGIRIAESMKEEAGLGGTIVNSKGNVGEKEAWGVQADWVDYYGPIGDKTLGIAILCHPTTFHYPNRWHVRKYGLFAANPFGVHHFLGQSEPTAGVDLPTGESMTFRYRVIFHEGDATAANIAGQHAEYMKTSFTALDE